MYRRPKFLEILLHIREEMARDADYDVDRYVEMVRSGTGKKVVSEHSLTDEVSGQAERVRRPSGKPRA